MSKKVLILVLAVVLVGALAFYFTKSSAPEVATDSASFKIGLVTGTVSQNEDEYRGAEAAIAKYPGLVKHVTYPDNFMQEQETYIAQITGLAADPEVKAIIVNQAVPGTIAAIRRVRETRPEMIFIAGEPHEDPPLIEPVVDVTLIPNQPERGKTIPQLAKEMGATALLHYSFPRHMSYAQLAERRDIMRAESEKLGMLFIDVNAPDPMGEGGIPAAQQFILEDVPARLLSTVRTLRSSPPTVRCRSRSLLPPSKPVPSSLNNAARARPTVIRVFSPGDYDEISCNFPAIVDAIDKKLLRWAELAGLLLGLLPPGSSFPLVAWKLPSWHWKAN